MSSLFKELKTEESNNWNNLYFLNIEPIENDIIKQEEFVFNILTKIEFISIDLYSELRNLITNIRIRYNNVYYHNFYHCLHVFTSINHLINDINNNLNQKNENNNIITSQEKFVLLYSALIHDIDHLGVFNSFLIKEEHSFALLYNHQSVAENRSISLGFELLNEYDILKDKSKDVQKSIKNLIIDIILSTDAADIDRRLLTSTKITRGFANNLDSKLDLTKGDARLSLFLILIKCSDIGASLQSFETTYLMAKRFFDEQHYAYKTSRGDLVDRNSFNIGQEFFYDHVRNNLIPLMESTGIFTDELIRDVTSNIIDNKLKWSNSDKSNNWVFF